MNEGLTKPKLVWDPVIFQAVDAASRAKLGEADEYRDKVRYLGRLAKWQRFGCDVIRRYEREKRLQGWLGFYYRWWEGRRPA